MNALEQALDAASYEWLVANHPNIAEAVEAEIKAGATPGDIRRCVIRHTQRVEMALRCEQAARWLVGG